MTASPQRAQDGNYYMMGDADCQRYKVQSGFGNIECYDGKSKFTGVRAAMTNQDIQMWQFRQHEQAEENRFQRQQNNFNAYQYKPTNCTSNVIGGQVFTNCY